MKIYTKTGDRGTTALIGGTRVKKHHVRIESYGTIDELNSWLGLIRDQEASKEFKEVLVKIQNELFVVGSLLAVDPEKESLKKVNRMSIPELNNGILDLLESEIDQMNETLLPMTHFILPGGHTSVSYCHIARTVCRRAERMCTLLHEKEPLNNLVLSFLNRLSDYLFVLARKLSQQLQAEEVKWIP
ncbi:MAG: ATP:cob(I)alamin adenosyltransferase [Pseudozobellia sp.]|nr:ATP:cob(I)alamin adenosyltransferase [Pseudozobellia sp.]MBG49839.1 ATP:cob(I)alamin adenosyltransferase [Pseudozobellia sp.]|tara:strand:+ start:138051 stop:138611 length:561 start_codon:yes stop_codon:yes gene_type:complete